MHPDFQVYFSHRAERPTTSELPSRPWWQRAALIETVRTARVAEIERACMLPSIAGYHKVGWEMELPRWTVLFEPARFGFVCPVSEDPDAPLGLIWLPFNRLQLDVIKNAGGAPSPCSARKCSTANALYRAQWVLDAAQGARRQRIVDLLSVSPGYEVIDADGVTTLERSRATWVAFEAARAAAEAEADAIEGAPVPAETLPAPAPAEAPEAPAEE